MRTRKAEVEITYNGAAVTTKLAKYETEVTYTDPASGEADTLDIWNTSTARSMVNTWILPTLAPYFPLILISILFSSPAKDFPKQPPERDEQRHENGE